MDKITVKAGTSKDRRGYAQISNFVVTVSFKQIGGRPLIADTKTIMVT